MRPRFNSLPYRPNHPQNDGTTTASASQQVIPSSHCQGNPTNLFPNSSQIQSQMGIINPQMATPFNNSNTHMGNGPVAMSNVPFSAPMGAPNQNVMPLLGSSSVITQFGQFHGGLGPQNPNSMPIARMNLIQTPSQFFTHNSGNLPQYSNPNSVFPNGQLFLQSPMPNINQFVQMPMPNYNQVAPCNMHLYSNQVSQAMAPQNPTFFANQQFGLLHSNAVLQPSNQGQHNNVLSKLNANAPGQSYNTTQQSQGNSPLPPAFGSVPPQQTPKDFRPPVSTNSQGNLRKDGGINNWNNNWKNSQNRNFTKNQRRDESRRGVSKSQLHNVQNSNGKYRPNNKYGGKGCKNDGARPYEHVNSTNHTQRRSLPLNYTAQEILQWREARRKNYPSKSNVEKKLAEKLTEPEVIDKDTKLRRQQLKEVLAKQAELGCEVAEIPSSYLSDSEKQVHGREVDKKAFPKKEKFQNKSNKRGRNRQKERFTKKQRLTDHGDSSNSPSQDKRFSEKQNLADNGSRTNPSLNKKQPTLLQKLLSADIRKDKRHILQVFRFMVMNSFFKDCPEKPLRFPLVIVKDTASEGEVVEEKTRSLGRGVSDTYNKTSIGESEHRDYRDGGVADDGKYNNDEIAKAVGFVSLKCGKGGEAQHEEEEGEIID
ncbi:Nuclear fragile X mental retardation-interacting protein 1, conserved domain protein [Actinidia chinensis var. chinensis]|uniref:Nuclear fragile X mental retardation-interacting protein 1, conserved domain protein n=1 Tax=Actinidia chinensis var. chinensis TaxID=1590841 RepID=A0A2R6RDV0_ACTCC|nr:Nuclear fragile X mental retardation-interacting protein 1, conserved domain protein [Actinidia chinensis var. chinensis]